MIVPCHLAPLICSPGRLPEHIPPNLGLDQTWSALGPTFGPTWGLARPTLRRIRTKLERGRPSPWWLRPRRGWPRNYLGCVWRRDRTQRPRTTGARPTRQVRGARMGPNGATIYHITRNAVESYHAVGTHKWRSNTTSRESAPATNTQRSPGPARPKMQCSRHTRRPRRAGAPRSSPADRPKANTPASAPTPTAPRVRFQPPGRRPPEHGKQTHWPARRLCASRHKLRVHPQLSGPHADSYTLAKSRQQLPPRVCKPLDRQHEALR